ncbi:hypothetical protein BDN72DRAFT_375629 [Pluteus cervinus]|uniref:Uncharacterized protein n=1 Tax=Pluteus cervinus TaxID=181527 RepID=A0ACD3ABJ3_9AGAR|nr:hypothetical protein BDN72DRAFT_375629 [Pluteus cervinus]
MVPSRHVPRRSCHIDGASNTQYTESVVYIHDIYPPDCCEIISLSFVTLLFCALILSSISFCTRFSFPSVFIIFFLVLEGMTRTPLCSRLISLTRSGCGPGGSLAHLSSPHWIGGR